MVENFVGMTMNGLLFVGGRAS